MFSYSEQEANTTNDKNYLAEIGTLHLEYTYLSEITRNPIYRQKVNVIRDWLNQKAKPYNGLYPSEVNVITGEWTSGEWDSAYLFVNVHNFPNYLDYITIGPPTDSVFEYFLKSYIQTGAQDRTGLEMYYDSIDAFFNGLIQTSSPSNLEYISEMINGTVDPVMHHLACFAGKLVK